MKRYAERGRKTRVNESMESCMEAKFDAMFPERRQNLLTCSTADKVVDVAHGLLIAVEGRTDRASAKAYRKTCQTDC